MLLKKLKTFIELMCTKHMLYLNKKIFKNKRDL